MKKKILILFTEIVALVSLYYFLKDSGLYLINFIVLYWTLLCYVVNKILIKEKEEFVNTLIFVISILGLFTPFFQAFYLLFSDDILYILFALGVMIAILGYLISYVLVYIKERKDLTKIIFISYFVLCIIVLNIFYFWHLDLIF